MSVPESPHRIVNPDSLAPPVGYAHAVVSAPGRLVFLGGQTSHDTAGVLRGESLVEQFDLAAANVIAALQSAGGGAEHVVSMQIFVTDAEGYRRSLRDLGQVYRRHFGRHYPAMALVEVAGLFDPASQVELMCVAVVPD